MSLAVALYSGQSGEVESVADRIRKAMQLRGMAARGGQSLLAQKSGLTSGAITRILKEPNKTPALETIHKLADALDVRRDWLAWGYEPMLDVVRSVARDEQYPNRAKAIEAARLLRTASEEAIEAIRAWTDHKEAEAWTERDWYDELLTEERRRRRGRVEATRDFEDEAPPGLKKGKKR